MTIYELDVLMQKIMKNNEIQIIYPITKIKNVIDENNNSLEDFLLDFVSAFITEDDNYLITEDGNYIIAE